MSFNRAREQFSGLTSRFGFGKVAGCGCLGCTLPIIVFAMLFVVVGWWLFATPVQTQERTAIRYTAPSAPALTNGQRASTAPTPVYAQSNAQGAVRHPELPSMMGNQPLHADYRIEGLADYTPNDLVLPTGLYLGYANLTGARRTPYVKGQTLSNGMTVVTGDFDFVLLQDAGGTQWFCDPSGVNCTFWR